MAGLLPVVPEHVSVLSSKLSFVTGELWGQEQAESTLLSTPAGLQDFLFLF